MVYAKRFFINSSNKKMIGIYQTISKEFKKDLSHIESTYNEILSDKKSNADLLKEKEEIQKKITNLLSNFTGSYIKDSQGLLKDIFQLKINILQLKTKFMLYHILFNNHEFDIEDYELAVNLHNSLSEFHDNVVAMTWDKSDRTLNCKYFDYAHSLVQEQYEKLAVAFSIGDPWENWSYDEEEDSDSEDFRLEINP
ncbi:hypothetical protein OQJ19_13860 [Fluoribacter gormanii]|uniref:Uncharacterized protein n=1 Tax=Fluoribacter gormanii TaxID=464 RepID=A0A377GK24_9GAMM|nr:hypothetical protein [Fluoribacter gormanii]KTD02483.1 hypothetical protein Lgor_1775 [Fluoribacter gormanii]MCW8471723.1 hypothetical protein [Fluoribacter gormanii]SIR45974.1 hypothetical protein SAMN05421777_112106 [Fluoribacter gormanii]STO25166.1 Uncharacterised protein [Fluoribacter gormanii]